MRLPHATSSSNQKTLSSDIIGTLWRTSANGPTAPHRRLGGRIGRPQLGVGRLQRPKLPGQGVVRGVGDLGVVEGVVALVVMGDQPSQLVDPGDLFLERG